MKNLPFLFLLLFFAACKSDDIGVKITNYQLGVPFEVAVGGTAFCDCEAPVVEFETVVRDHRCSQGARCGWPGDAVVRISNGVDTLRLSTWQRPISPSRVDTLDGFIYSLIDLSPLPDRRPIEQRDYRLEMKIEKL